jgi:hypothetical protein
MPDLSPELQAELQQALDDTEDRLTNNCQARLGLAVDPTVNIHPNARRTWEGRYRLSYTKALTHSTNPRTWTGAHGDKDRVLQRAEQVRDLVAMFALIVFY